MKKNKYEISLWEDRLVPQTGEGQSIAPEHYKEENAENRPIVSVSLTGKDSSGNTKNILKITPFILNSEDVGFQINTKSNLIEGIDSQNIATGNLYNKYIIEGDFFKIPPQKEGLKISVTGATPIEIAYDYIYY